MNLENKTSEPTQINLGTPKSQAMSFLFGGLIPVILFTLIEEKYGTLAGLIAGMIFGGGEIIFEKIKYNKVTSMTWIGNGLLIGLGAISLIFQDGLWFKLQPAIFEFGFFIFLIGSWLMKKPFLVMMLEKQNPAAPDFLKTAMSGFTLRLSFFFLFHAVIATWAAIHWSTEAWATLKGVGLTVSMIFYMFVEVVWIRLKNKKRP